MIKFVGFALVGMTMLSTSAMAVMQSFTATFGPTKTDFGPVALTLPSFNTALGTLTNVSLALGASATVGGNVTNSTATPQSFKVTTDTNIALTSALASLNGVNVDLVTTQTYASVASGATAAYGPFTPSASASVASALPLSDFTGGPLTFTAGTLSSTTILGGGNNISAAINSTASGVVTVTYTYSAPLPPPPPPSTVPEPASMALLGMGLAGLGLVRRRRS